MPAAAVANRHIWPRYGLLAVLLIASLVPLLLPEVPPLVDLPGHMGRYRVELDSGQTELVRYFAFHWYVIGNLGVDLLIVPMAQLFGLELGVKLIVMAIPVLTVAGLLWVAREAHGHVPPTALFALPLAYGHPFLFGFVNFTLSMALALLALALWLRLARLGQLGTRAIVFVPVACALWLTHTFGWGVLGILAYSAELVRQPSGRRRWYLAPFRAALHCCPLTPPLILMWAWRSGHAGGDTFGWFDWTSKWFWLQAVLRDRFATYDIASAAMIAAVPALALIYPRFKLSPTLLVATIALAFVFVLMPKTVFGSAYADMRVAPYLLALAALMVTPRARAGPRLRGALFAAGLCFFGARIATTTASLYDSGREQARALTALDRLPVGARVVNFVGQPCRRTWLLHRNWHLGGMAMVRRRAFSNDQWAIAGSSPMTVMKADAPGFVADPSQMVVSDPCPRWLPQHIDTVLARLPRAAFDYVWLIDVPRYDARLTTGMATVWQDGDDRLLRIVRR